MLRRHADYLVGLDAFAPALQVAKGRKVYDDLIRADILHLPLRSERIDCVTIFDVIEIFEKLAVGSSSSHFSHQSLSAHQTLTCRMNYTLGS
jgi:predicted TPR repeat methyltransferase